MERKIHVSVGGCQLVSSDLSRHITVSMKVDISTFDDVPCETLYDITEDLERMVRTAVRQNLAPTKEDLFEMEQRILYSFKSCPDHPTLLKEMEWIRAKRAELVGPAEPAEPVESVGPAEPAEPVESVEPAEPA